MGDLHCRTCRGKNCKFENYDRWLGKKDSHPALRGLYSSWITDDIVAMARPSEKGIVEHGLMDQFRALGIGAIFNCQQPGEHRLCGEGLVEEGGFSYRPQTVMEAGVAFYNFCWKDMKLPTLDQALSAVQVMGSHMDQHGHKIAVHCHAGLGRTGLLIACLLVLRENYKPVDAVALVRLKRPGSIQTAKQLEFVTTFADHVRGLRIQFSPHVKRRRSSGRAPQATTAHPWTLRVYMQNQHALMHGEQRRAFFRTPKFLALIDQAIAPGHAAHSLTRRARARPDSDSGNRRSSVAAVNGLVGSSSLQVDLGAPQAATSFEAFTLSEAGTATTERGEGAHNHISLLVDDLREALDDGNWDLLNYAGDVWLLFAVVLMWLEEFSEPVVDDSLAADTRLDGNDAPMALWEADARGFTANCVRLVGQICRGANASKQSMIGIGLSNLDDIFGAICTRAAQALLKSKSALQGAWSSFLLQEPRRKGFRKVAPEKVQRLALLLRGADFDDERWFSKPGRPRGSRSDDSGSRGSSVVSSDELEVSGSATGFFDPSRSKLGAGVDGAGLVTDFATSSTSVESADVAGAGLDAEFANRDSEADLAALGSADGLSNKELDSGAAALPEVDEVASSSTDGDREPDLLVPLTAALS